MSIEVDLTVGDACEVPDANAQDALRPSLSGGNQDPSSSAMVGGIRMYATKGLVRAESCTARPQPRAAIGSFLPLVADSNGSNAIIGY